MTVHEASQSNPRKPALPKPIWNVQIHAPVFQLPQFLHIHIRLTSTHSTRTWNPFSGFCTKSFTITAYKTRLPIPCRITASTKHPRGVPPPDKLKNWPLCFQWLTHSISAKPCSPKHLRIPRGRGYPPCQTSLLATSLPSLLKYAQEPDTGHCSHSGRVRLQISWPCCLSSR